MTELRPREWLGGEADPEVAARLTELYELSFGEKGDDLDFFRSMARRTGGPILELGCGTGRVTIPLARDGHRVVGMDVSSAQLDVARRKAAAAGVNAEFILADMRDFALPEPFALVIIPFNTFLHAAPAERPAVLARVREHLSGNGVFVLDVFQPDPAIISAAQGALVLDWTRRDPSNGRTVSSSTASEADVDGVRFTIVYDETATDGTTRRYAHSATLHYLYRRELELLLPACGLTIDSMYGSYELDPVTPRSPKLLTVARRRERGEGRDRRAQ